MPQAPIMKILRVFLLLPLLGAAGGCVNQVTIPSWQREVVRYVRDEADADPTALRDITLPDGRRGFAVIAHHDTRESTDANGLLLSHERAGGQMWLIYLVGLVEKQRVTDIRLAALSMDENRSTWRRGLESKPSLRAYRQGGLQDAHARFPDRKTPPPRYLGFPRPDDSFELVNSSGHLVATHQPSGARWELTLPNAKR